MAILEMEIILSNSRIITGKWYFNVTLCCISHYSNKTNPELYLFYIYFLYCSISICYGSSHMVFTILNGLDLPPIIYVLRLLLTFL